MWYGQPIFQYDSVPGEPQTPSLHPNKATSVPMYGTHPPHTTYAAPPHLHIADAHATLERPLAYVLIET